MATWVVAYECSHAIIVEGCTREEALLVEDHLGCKAVAVYSPGEVFLKTDPWVKNGQLRCDGFTLRKDASPDGL